MIAKCSNMTTSRDSIDTTWFVYNIINQKYDSQTLWLWEQAEHPVVVQLFRLAKVPQYFEARK